MRGSFVGAGAGEGVEIALHTEHLGGFTRVSNQD
jgi:hypothetical protein